MIFDELGKFLKSVFDVVWRFITFIADIVQIPFMYIFKGSPKTFLGWILQLVGAAIYICVIILAIWITVGIIIKISVWIMDRIYKVIYRKDKEINK